MEQDMKQKVNNVGIDLAKMCSISWALTREEQFSGANG